MWQEMHAPFLIGGDMPVMIEDHDCGTKIIQFQVSFCVLHETRCRCRHKCYILVLSWSCYLLYYVFWTYIYTTVLSSSFKSPIYYLCDLSFGRIMIQEASYSAHRLSPELSQSSMHSQHKSRKLCLMGTLCRGGGNILGPIDVSAPPHQFFVDQFRDACGKEADRSKIWNPLEIFLCWRFGPRFGFLVVHHVTWS
jgi:hypothetical protein